MKIKKAYAVYTGGNIWLFYGQLADGNYFLTDDNGFTLLLDADPCDLEESTFREWQDAHKVRDIDEDERRELCDRLMDYLEEHLDDRGGMSDAEIGAYREYLQILY